MNITDLNLGLRPRQHQHAGQDQGATRASMMSTFEPVVTVLLAAVWLGESVSMSQLLGGALILAGVLVLSRPQAEVEVSDIHD